MQYPLLWGVKLNYKGDRPQWKPQKENMFEGKGGLNNDGQWLVAMYLRGQPGRDLYSKMKVQLPTMSVSLTLTLTLTLTLSLTLSLSLSLTLSLSLHLIPSLFSLTLSLPPAPSTKTHFGGE